MTQPIELHYWPTPNGIKISLALEEMGMPYTIVPVNIGKGEQFSPEFLALSPNNRIPAILDPEGPDGQPISVFESGAILQYLARKSGRFGGTDARAQADVEQWLFWQVGGLGPMAGQANHFRSYGPSFLKDQRMIAYGVNRYTNEVHRLWGVIDKRLADRDFVAGDYSIADMACWPWMRAPESHGVDPEEFPHANAWRARIGARPAAIKAVADGDNVRATTTNLAGVGAEADKARDLLFTQRARK
jgi:glutathione S-transferase/GST-like protein